MVFYSCFTHIGEWGYTLLCFEVTRNKAIAVKIVIPVHQAGHLGMFVAWKNSDILLDWIGLVW